MPNIEMAKYYRDRIDPRICSITRESCDEAGDCRICSFSIFRKIVRDEDNPNLSWVRTWEQYVVCKVCDGEGIKPGKRKEGFPPQVCPSCMGRGEVEVTMREVRQTKRKQSK